MKVAMSKTVVIPYSEIVAAIPPSPYTRFSPAAWELWLAVRGVTMGNLVEVCRDEVLCAYVCNVREVEGDD